MKGILVFRHQVPGGMEPGNGLVGRKNSSAWRGHPPLSARIESAKRDFESGVWTTGGQSTWGNGNSVHADPTFLNRSSTSMRLTLGS